MDTTSTGPPGLVRKSVTWSMILSVLMIVAGFLAIVVPPAAGLAVTILVGWLLVLSGVMHFVYAWHMRSMQLFGRFWSGSHTSLWAATLCFIRY